MARQLFKIKDCVVIPQCLLPLRGTSFDRVFSGVMEVTDSKFGGHRVSND